MLSAPDLALDYGFPPDAIDDIQDTLDLAGALLRLAPPRVSIREREREAHRHLKADPADIQAWCVLFRAQVGREPVIFDSQTRQLSIGRSTVNRDSRRRTDHQLNACVLHLLGLWEHYHLPPKTDDDGTDDDGTDDERKNRRFAKLNTWDGNASPALEFLSEALLCLGVHPTRATPNAIRKRLERRSR